METNKVVEPVRSVLASVWEDEETVRQFMATDPRFDVLCSEYRKVIKLLDGYEAQVNYLRELRAWLEEELLTRSEGYQPH